MFTPLSKMSPGLQAHLVSARHLLDSICDLRPLPPDVAVAVLCSQQRVAALTDCRCRTQSQSCRCRTPSTSRVSWCRPVLPGWRPVSSNCAPGSSTQSFTVTDAYVPASQSNASGANNPNLSAFMVATSDLATMGS